MSSTASPSTPLAGSRRGNSPLRILWYVIWPLLLLLFAALGWLYSLARSALPQLDGSVAVSGISSNVSVVRDQHGFPTIEAASLADLFFAQGYVTAQDRLWQMDIMRRAAAGELSEIIGPDTLPMDRGQRILGLRAAAESAEKNISARDRLYFDAYTQGVNAFMESHRDHLSLEFRVLKYQPRPWTVIDSLLVGARMVQDLNHSSNPPALTREKILAKLGPQLTADLYVNSSWRDRPPGGSQRIDAVPAGKSGDSDEEDDEEVDPDDGPSRLTSEVPSGLVPQGLKPVQLRALGGTAEAVPFPKPNSNRMAEGVPSSKPFLERMAEAVTFPKSDSIRTAEAALLPKPNSNLTAEAVPFPTPNSNRMAEALTYSKPYWEGMADAMSYTKPYLERMAEALPFPTLDEHDLFRPGSNNWVVSGQHTVSGKPLLSNDMHLDHQMPNLWYAAHLRTANGDFDVAGVTLPGIPFVIVGHNQRIGWGFTNVGPTVEDDYIEEFNPQGQYKTPAGWVEPQHRQETIHVKGKPDVVTDVVITRHGPIVTELLPGETRKIALRWTLQDGMGQIFFDVNTARDWGEFRKAFSNFGAPGQNVMYADVDGHIGYQATGRVPIRASGDGSLPVSGSDDAHEWKGWIPFDEMPRAYDPPSGILASANGRITPDGYKYSISTEWEAPWRTDRIYRVLESGKKFAPADMLALQMDISSTYDRLCAEKFVYAIDHAANASDRAKRAADILRDWDGRMSADSAAPTIETKARAELVRLLLEPKLGAISADSDRGELNWKSYRWAMSSVWLENVISKQPPRWLPQGYADYGSLLTAAVENVVKQTESSSDAKSKGKAPADLTQWKWGNNYQVAIDHPVLGQLPLAGRYTGPGVYPLSGSNLTVKAVGRGFGPSERLTWNFANFEESTLNLVTGESGIFLSPHYLDQWKAWYEGSTFRFPFTVSAVAQHRDHQMTLEPR
jgi:penicillin amidase